LRLLTVFISAIYVLASPFMPMESSSPVLVDTHYPGAYITPGQTGCHHAHRQRLVLHNNYRFPIVITLISFESGDIKPSYEVVVEDNGRSRVIEQYTQEVQTSQAIRSQAQISMCIEAENISSSKYIRIPFKIDNESDSGSAAAPEHFVVFYGEGLKN
jgi:hydrogenase maturation factor